MAASLVAASFACNTPAALAADDGLYSSHGGKGSFFPSAPRRGGGNLTFLPQDKGDESPACLDGSPYGFYFVPSKTGSTKWTISIEGGGWCYDERDCYSRSKMDLGSSKGWAAEAAHWGCGCMNTVGDGIDGDCNCALNRKRGPCTVVAAARKHSVRVLSPVTTACARATSHLTSAGLYMPYADGASFSGYRPKPWPVPGSPGEHLTFRGIKNLDATLDWAFAHGMDKASEFVLTGGSAGGLSTFLHADRVAGRLRREAPGIEKVVAAPVVGCESSPGVSNPRPDVVSGCRGGVARRL